MRTVDEGYRAGAEKNIRDVDVKILTNDDEEKAIYADRIVRLTIQRSISGGSFSIGNAPSDRLNAVIVGTEKLPKKTRITVYVRFDGGEWERLGRFYADSCTRNGQRVTVTAYDALSLAEKPVKFGGNASLDKLNFPCSMQEMLDYIVALRGMTCLFECQPFTVEKKPMKSETEYYTARELFGLIAACHGCNAKMDSDGKLVFREFGEAPAALTAANVLDQTIDDGEPFTVRGVLFQKDENTTFYIDDVPGSEYDEEADGIVKCYNPLATVEIAEYVWNRLGNLSYYGGSVKLRGAGILECGDVISVGNLKYPADAERYPLCVTDISYSISRDGGFIETLSSEVTRKSPTSGTAPASAASSYAAGTGIAITGKEIELKRADGEGMYFNEGWKDALGGVYIDRLTTGSYGSLEIHNGALRLLPANTQTIGGVSVGRGLRRAAGNTMDSSGKIEVCLGRGMWFDADPKKSSTVYDSGIVISPHLGDGLDFIEREDEAAADQGALTLNLGKGLQFTAREPITDEDGEETGAFRSRVEVKLGEGMRFGANGELIAEAGTYKAGENIVISDDKTISAEVKEYKAGKNITISDDGTIDAEGGASLTAGGGITIETDEETGVQKVSAAVGEGAEIRGGKICTVPNIQSAVIIKEADAKYLLHDFTEIGYYAGNQIGYAGPKNQTIVQGYLAYENSAFNANDNGYGGSWSKESDIPSALQRYTAIGGRFYLYHYGKIARSVCLSFASTNESNLDTYNLIAAFEDGSTETLASFSNYNHWSGVSLAIQRSRILSPGTTGYNDMFLENGGIAGYIYRIYKSSSSSWARYRSVTTSSGKDTWIYMPFSSLAEYQAAVGLTYEPLTLTRVEDNPTVVSGGR